MNTQSNNIQESNFYKFIKYKTGNRKLDESLAELKYNSMPIWVRLTAQEVAQ